MHIPCFDSSQKMPHFSKFYGDLNSYVCKLNTNYGLDIWRIIFKRDSYLKGKVNQWAEQEALKHASSEKLHIRKEESEMIGRWVTRILAVRSWPESSNWESSLFICFTCTSFLFFNNFNLEDASFKDILLHQIQKKNQIKSI